MADFEPTLEEFKRLFRLQGLPDQELQPFYEQYLERINNAIGETTNKNVEIDEKKTTTMKSGLKDLATNILTNREVNWKSPKNKTMLSVLRNYPNEITQPAVDEFVDKLLSDKDHSNFDKLKAHLSAVIAISDLFKTSVGKKDNGWSYNSDDFHCAIRGNTDIKCFSCKAISQFYDYSANLVCQFNNLLENTSDALLSADMNENTRDLYKQMIGTWNSINACRHIPSYNYSKSIESAVGLLKYRLDLYKHGERLLGSIVSGEKDVAKDIRQILRLEHCFRPHFRDICERFLNDHFAFLLKEAKALGKQETLNTYLYIKELTDWMKSNNFNIQEEVKQEINGIRPYKSEGGRHVAAWLYNHNISFDYEPTLPGLVYKNPLHPDFYIKDMGCIIEFDGQQHNQPVSIWGGEEAFVVNKERDNMKDQYATDNGYTLIRLHEKDLKHLDEKLAFLLKEQLVKPKRSFDEVVAEAKQKAAEHNKTIKNNKANNQER